MKNRIASLFLVFALLMSLCNFAVARDNRITVQSGGAERFTDVPTDHWAYAYINQVVGSGLFNGKTETTFEPSNAMTRSQFVMVMARMEGMSSLEGQYTVTKFPDVTPTRRAAGPIAWASADEQGFVRGFGDGTFKPDSPITRGQFAALIHRYIIAKRYTNLHVVDPIPAQFTDADSVSSAFTEDVEYARIHGLLTGYSDGTVRASNPITRAAIAAILARFLDLVTESGYTPLLDGPVIDDGKTDDGKTDEPPVNVPTSYNGIRLSVTNAKRGTTSFVSVLRNGVQVASDDVQPGDVVTISHVPQDGYRAKITVKDSKGRTVAVTTNGNVSTFVMPENMPVTITLKYLAQSSGGSGGSSSGGGSSSSSGGGGTVITATPYYLTINATAGAGGSVYLSQSIPQAGAEIPTDASVIGSTASFTFTRNNTGGIATVIGYAVFVPDSGYSFEGASTTSAGTTLTPAGPDYSQYNVAMKRNGADVTVTYVMITGSGAPSGSVTPAVNVNGTFTGGGNPGPGPVTERTWTVNVTNSDEFAYYSLVDAAPTAPTALTANGATSIQKTVTNGTAASVYLIITPKSGYKFGDEVVDFNPVDGSTATLIAPTPGNAAETDTVRVYRITRSTFLTPTATTNVTLLMQLASGVGRTYSVTVRSLLWNQDTQTTGPMGDVPLEATVDLNPATYLNKVTLNVPFLTGYRGYQLHGNITVEALNDDGSVDASVTVALKTESTSETGNEYSFVMPDKAVRVTVIYEAKDNPNLSYDVNVNLTGAGTVSLNIAGLNKTTEASTTYHVKMDDGAVIVTEGSDTTGTAMTKADYVELYGNEDFTQTVYLNAAPIAGKNYKFESVSYNGTAVSADNISAEQTVQDGTALNVNVDFSQVTSYGYTLTVIGKGTVSNSNFNGGFSYVNETGLPQTYSSGLIVTNTNTLNLSATPTVASGKSASDYDVTISANGQTSTTGSATVNLTQGELTNIVVEMQDKDRGAIAFTVTVTNDAAGTVKVKPESGKIMLAGAYNAEQAKERLSSNNNTLDDYDLSRGQSQSFYALENSVITILPTTTNTKVASITVTRNPGGAASDVLNTKGFSFQLTAETSAVVKFGTFDSYTVKFQAPYDDSDAGLRSFSANIAGSDNPNATVRDVLYSLNDGQRNAASSNNTSKITNEFFATPVNLNKTLAYYFSNPVVKADNGSKITGAQNVKDILEDSIKSSISSVFPSVVEAKKADLKADSSNVTGPIRTEMQNRQTNAETREVTGAAKSTVLEATPYREQLMNGTLQESNFRVLANVTTILSAAKETELRTQYPALANDLTGKSAETQLSGFVTDYLGKIQVESGYNYDNLNPVFTVTPNSTSSSTPTLDISAVVTASGAWPQLDSSISMTQYADRFNIWILVDIAQVLYDANGDGLFDATTEALQLTNTAPTLYNAAQLGVTVDKDAMLRNIDSQVTERWNSNFSANGVAIDMTQVLSAEMIGDVVKDVIEGPSDTLTTKITSLGDGENTRAAFMNLYDDFVECNPKAQNGQILTLKTKDGTPTPIGTVTNNNQTLHLEIDFTEINGAKILRDAAPPTDHTSFEQLVDLLIGLRNGVSTDIRVTSEASDKNQSAQSVIASLIENQLNGRNRDAVTVTKWGTVKQGSRLTAAERKEIANLIAGLVMNSEMSDEFNDAWQAFEDSGYQSVTFAITLDAGKRAGLAPILESYYGNTSTTTLKVGFNVTQVIN